jgi:hypothetical protein
MDNPENNTPATVIYNLPDALTLTYVGEGAANVVYRIDVHSQPRPIIPSELEGTPTAERALSKWKHHQDAATYLSSKLSFSCSTPSLDRPISSVHFVTVISYSIITILSYSIVPFLSDLNPI